MTGEQLDEGTPTPSGDRKRKGASDSPRKVMAFRVTPDLYGKLQASSQQRQLSLTEEIERRLALSFDLASNPQNEYITRSLAQTVNNIENLTASTWGKDQRTARMCQDAIVAAASVMTAIHDKPEDTPELKIIAAAAEVIGIRTVLNFAGFPPEAIVRFGDDDVDKAVDLIRRSVVRQVHEAEGREPNTITVEIDTDDTPGLGKTPPTLIKDPTPKPRGRAKAKAPAND